MRKVELSEIQLSLGKLELYFGDYCSALASGRDKPGFGSQTKSEYNDPTNIRYGNGSGRVGLFIGKVINY
jgi:hypothetical protein